MSLLRHDVGPLMSRGVESDRVVALAGSTVDDTSVGIKDQTQQVLNKIDRLLALAGTDKLRLLTALIYLKDIGLRPQMNEVWAAGIDPENPPTRACVGVQLVGEALVEIIVTAAAVPMERESKGDAHGHAHAHGKGHGHAH